MANLKEKAEWAEGIYQIEMTDPVVGGEDGIDNTPHKQLAARTLFLKSELEKQGATLESFSPETQAELILGVAEAKAGAAANAARLSILRTTGFQELHATIRNRGVKSGVELTKSRTATRNISASDGVVFMDGREYPVDNQTNTASVASNTTAEDGTVIIYMFRTEAGIIDVAATTLNGEMPEGAIELARAAVPAGNTESNDPYLENVIITDSARREPGWPTVQRSPAFVPVPLAHDLPDGGYQVTAEIEGGEGRCGDVYAADKLANGFKLFTTGSADNVSARLLVQCPGLNISLSDSEEE